MVKVSMNIKYDNLDVTEIQMSSYMCLLQTTYTLTL